jgi:hypothetical protein
MFLCFGFGDMFWYNYTILRQTFAGYFQVPSSVIYQKGSRATTAGPSWSNSSRALSFLFLAYFFCKLIQFLVVKLLIPVNRSVSASPSTDPSPEPLRDFSRFSIAAEDPAAEPADA